MRGVVDIRGKFSAHVKGDAGKRFLAAGTLARIPGWFRTLHGNAFPRAKIHLCGLETKELESTGGTALWVVILVAQVLNKSKDN